MTDTKPKPNDEVELVAFNMSLQIAVDKDDNVWTVDGWFGEGDDDEIPMVPVDDPAFDEAWAEVEYVTLWSDHLGDRQWTAVRPDDFERPTDG